jgi:hypothetical protein
MIRLFLLYIQSFLILAHLFAAPAQVVIVSYAESTDSGNLTSTGSCNGVERANYFPSYLSSTATLNAFGPPAALYGARQTAAYPGLNVLQSLTPSSRYFRIPIHAGYSYLESSGLADEILNNPDYDGKTVFIVWDFYEIPDLINAFGYSSPALPTPVAYNRTYVLPFPINNPFPLTLCQNLVSCNPLCVLCDSSCTTPPPPPPPAPPAPPSPPAPPAPPTPPPPLTDYLPITFVDTNAALFDTWVVITGKVPIGQGITPTQACFVNIDTTTGKGTRVNTTSSNTSLDYAFKLSALPKTGNNPYIYVPYLESGRIYFSIGKLGGTDEQWALDLYTTANSTGGYDIVESRPLLSTDPNYYLLYDKAEFSFLPTGRESALNVTAVDFFGLPIYVQLLLSNPTSSNATQSCGFWQSRSSCFQGFETIINSSNDQTKGKLWGNLFINYELPGNSLVDLRLSSTQAAIAFTASNPSTPIFPTDYLSNPSYFEEAFNWVDQIWKNYYAATGSQSLYIDCTEVAAPYNTTMSGKTATTSPFDFNFSNSSGSVTLSASIDLPSTSYGFFSADFASFGAISDVQKVFVKNITSGFSSGIFPVNGSGQTLNQAFFEQNKGSYYTNNFLQAAYQSQTGPFYDLYAKAIHQCFPSNPPQIYAFAYDDQLGQDGTTTFDVSEDPYYTFTFGSLENETLVDPYSSTQAYTVTITSIGADTTVTINDIPYTSASGSVVLPGTFANVPVVITKTSVPTITYTTKIYFTPPKGIQRPAYKGIAGTVITSQVVGVVGTASITFGAVS